MLFKESVRELERILPADYTETTKKEVFIVRNNINVITMEKEGADIAREYNKVYRKLQIVIFFSYFSTNL